MDLYCSEPMATSLFGSLFFMGVLLSMIILTFTNKFGRKVNLMVACFTTFTTTILLVSVPNLYTRYFGMFLLGCSVIKNVQSYILATELVPARYQFIVATCLLGFD